MNADSRTRMRSEDKVTAITVIAVAVGALLLASIIAVAAVTTSRNLSSARVTQFTACVDAGNAPSECKLAMSK